jgi:curved DNA-binding protein CbpA
VSKTLYEILGVPRGASERDVKAAYHRLARQLHPDKAEDGKDVSRLEKEFVAVSTAYNTLKDPEKRKAYDEHLSRSDKSPNEGGGSSSSGSKTPTSVANDTGKMTAAAIDKSKASVGRRAYLMGLKSLQDGDYTRSAEYFKMAIKNNPDTAEYHAKLALTFLRGKRGFSQAIEAANRAVVLDPYNTEFRIILAEIYESAGSKSLAIQSYEEILKWDPNHERALAALEFLRPSKKSFLKRLLGLK